MQASAEQYEKTFSTTHDAAVQSCAGYRTGQLRYPELRPQHWAKPAEAHGEHGLRSEDELHEHSANPAEAQETHGLRSEL